MKKLIFIAALFLASLAADAQVTHRFVLAGFNIQSQQLSTDSLYIDYTVQATTHEKFVVGKYPDTFQQVDTWIIRLVKNANYKTLRDSVRARSNNKYPNF